RLLYSGQQLRRALPLPRGVLATQETPVIEDARQQHQIVRAYLPPEEKVVPQSAVEVLHHAAGPHHLRRQRRHRVPQGRLPTPPPPSRDRKSTRLNSSH